MYGSHASLIVGYTYNADTYCPTHAVFALPTGPGQAYDGWALAPDATVLSPEDNLDEIAAAFGINRSDEHTFDSDDFPKVIFGYQACSPEDADPDAGLWPDVCATCHEPLLG